MVKLTFKVNVLIIVCFLMVLTLALLFTEKTLAQQVQQCPSSKSFPAKGFGEGVSPISCHNFLTGAIPQIINTPEVAEQEARISSTVQCSSNLASDIARATKECVKYCMSIPGCVAQASVNGPNTCNSDDATCHQESILGSSLAASFLHLIQQLIAIPQSQLFSSTVDVTVCNTPESTSIMCECNS